MLCAVIKGGTLDEARKQIGQARKHADLVELRLDHFQNRDLSDLRLLRKEFSIPMIFTLRNKSQGGNYLKSEEERLDEIRRLASLEPEFLDLENDVPPAFVEDIFMKYPNIKLIVSYHNFNETPDDLDHLFQKMQKLPAHYYKIALTAKNTVDALRLLCWAKKTMGNVIAISMGPHGQISRISGPIVKCPITYASLDDDAAMAPGQLSIRTLSERFHHASLNPSTSVYGLIGDPVDLSISDVTHNRVFHDCGLDAVYVKMQVLDSELDEFFPLARMLPFKGLSVTMPLKESILPYIDEIDSQAKEIGAVNTLLLQDGKIIGFNTDGMGALNAIEKVMSVQNKRVVIIGAGGAAKAIFYEAHRRGAIVTIVNRDVEKAKQLANRFQCIGKALEAIENCCKDGYDVIINSTPVSMPIEPKHILSSSLVMDIKTRPKQTPFLSCAEEKRCRIVYGYRLFVEQAVGQFHHWFKDRINVKQVGELLEKYASAMLTKAE